MVCPVGAQIVSPNGAFQGSEGQRPGQKVRKSSEPCRGDPNRRLIPDVSFIVGNPVPFEKQTVFFLGCLLAMVFPLIGDVFANGLHVGFGNSERSVAGLPCEVREARPLRFDTFGRRFFDVLDGLADGHRAGKIKE